MIIVTGALYVRSGAREELLSYGLHIMRMARRTPGCLDFSLCADPLEPDRVNVLERWSSQRELLAFRQAGPARDLSSLITRVEVKEYTAHLSPKR